MTTPAPRKNFRRDNCKRFRTRLLFMGINRG
jgi:hypothetical protein